MYQLFAYGHKYLSGRGDVVLIYPAASTFRKPLPVFMYTNDLRLWVLPLDLETGQVLRLDLPGIFASDDILQDVEQLAG